MPYSKLIEKRNSRKGFTVIELLIVMAIIAILGLVSIGPMLRWRANSFVETAANNLMSDFERAKIEAVRSGRNVTIAFTGTNLTTYNCFIDVNNNGVVDGNEMLFFRRDPEDGAGRVVTTMTGGTSGNRVIFTPRGFLSSANNAVITITGTSKQSNLTRTITVNRIGNVSSTAVNDRSY